MAVGLENRIFNHKCRAAATITTTTIADDNELKKAMYTGEDIL